jgi:uncharacterized protein YdhG (YjbR/CyaY superfamily)
MHKSMRAGRKYPVQHLPGRLPEKPTQVPDRSRGNNAMRNQSATIDEYIASFPAEIQEKLQGLRAVIRKAAPDAEEAIRYGIPTFRQNGSNLVHFAAFRDHLSFFPTSSGVAKFQKELSSYQLSKGTIQFPLDKPVPYDLVERITRFRAEENRQKKKA